MGGLQHRAHHETPGTRRQLNDFSHGVREDHGGRRNTFHRDGIEERNCRQFDKTSKDLIWLLCDLSLLAAGFDSDEPTQFAGTHQWMITLGLSIDEA